MNSPGLPGLPSLRFRTAFRNYEPYVRAATLVASVPVPVICLAIFFWLQPVWREINITVLVILPVVAVVSPAVFLKQNAIPHAVNLTPAAIEYRELARRTSIPTSEVSQVITVRTARREVFMVRDRGGKFVAFGPGLSRSDFEAARAWLRALAQAVGIEMREGLSVQEAMFLLHPGGPTRPR